MRYDIEVIQRAVIELLAQMQGATSITKKKLALDSGISRQHLGLVAKGKYAKAEVMRQEKIL